MKPKSSVVQSLKQSYHSQLQKKQEIKSRVLNISLLSNPILKDLEHYRNLTYEITQYNKRVLDGFISDQYEAFSHEKLFSIISDLGNIQLKEDMVNRLEESWKWWGEQKRKIKQRKDLGMVKYKIDRQTEKMRQYREMKLNRSQPKTVPSNLPCQIRDAQIYPYENNHRTVHEEMQMANKRLLEYKHKRLDVLDSHFKEGQDITQPIKKVTYPKPPKYVPTEQIPEIPQIGENVQTQIINPQNAQGANETNPQTQPLAQNDPNKPVAGQDPNQQDMGFGEEPGEPEEEGGEEEEQVLDRLAPKNKIYTFSNQHQQQYDSEKKYDRPYMYYRGTNAAPQRRMQEKAYLKMQYSLQIKRQEEQFIKRAHDWSTKKQKVDKQRQFLLERRVNKPSYSFSYEDPQTKQMLSVADQKKYGMYTAIKSLPKDAVVLDDKLPKIGEYRPVQRQLRNDRLKSLKSRFAKILDIKDNSEARVNQGSMCQVSPRRRDLSAILAEHSTQRQREKELQEIQKIKSNLGKQKININLRYLSRALVPDIEDYKLQSFQSPSQTLPSNPFWVQPAAKKKKKK